MRSIVFALFLAGGTAAAARGADLTKIERTIASEPVLRGQRDYCLLVFGPDAATRVWLIFDGNILYADRNGDGDLTQIDERFGLFQDDYDQKRGLSVWQIGDIKSSGTTYQGLTVTRITEAEAQRWLGRAGIGITVRVPIGSVMVPQS